MAQRLDIRTADFETAFSALLAAKQLRTSQVDEAVAAILAEVKEGGDAALIAFSKRFDGNDLTPETMRVEADELQRAVADCDPDVLAALELAAARISDFHRRQMPDDLDYVDPAGLRLGFRWTPVAAVGLYVPGGTAAYPSTVLMTALPAKTAAVERLVMTVPATDGLPHPLVLAAACIAGVDEVYQIGGAQAVAALAYGTETIRPVDKIVGPGNVYVAAAKRQVFGTVGIDTIAGPSEILIVADGDNDPSWIAADLLSQAEHDSSAQSILITDDADFATAVGLAVQEHLKILPRAEIAAGSWRANGCVIIVENLDQAVPLIDRIAPEHLELATEKAETLAARIRNCGAIFLGKYAPEAVGDYIAGPNHVLPTAGSARFASGLGVLDFLKRTSLVGCDKKALAAVGPAAMTLAKAEGLDAHALSLALRLNRRRNG